MLILSSYTNELSIGHECSGDSMVVVLVVVVVVVVVLVVVVLVLVLVVVVVVVIVVVVVVGGNALVCLRGFVVGGCFY